jgi:hypothetical protein
VNIILTFLFATILGGCAVRPSEASREPDTETIMEAYAHNSEEVVNAQRIREGW